jgi:hypothetical protein
MPSAAGSHCARVKDAFRQVMLTSRGSLVGSRSVFLHVGGYLFLPSKTEQHLIS